MKFLITLTEDRGFAGTGGIYRGSGQGETKSESEAIERAKLTNLRKDVSLTAEEETKVKPIIDRFVDGVQAARHDPSLDSRARRQQLATLREQYNTELDAVLTPDQQQKLASLKAQRIARLRAGRANSATKPEAQESAPAPQAQESAAAPVVAP